MIAYLIRWGFSFPELMEMPGTEIRFWFYEAIGIVKQENKDNGAND
jgi:hypothetical protein